MLFFDFEVFKYDWLVVAIDPVKKKEYVIVNNKAELEQMYRSYRQDIWVGFNCRNYDQYILKAILCGFNPKVINDWIIVKGRKGWEFSSMFNKIKLNLYDVMPNIPVSLKVLEGFMGNNIHETSVPFDINRKLTPSELSETIEYCRFDVLNTIEVFIRRKGEFDAQMDLLKAFNLPLSNLGKTQAQLAAVILDAKRVRYKDDWDLFLYSRNSSVLTPFAFNIIVAPFDLLENDGLLVHFHHYNSRVVRTSKDIRQKECSVKISQSSSFFYIGGELEVVASVRRARLGQLKDRVGGIG